MMENNIVSTKNFDYFWFKRLKKLKRKTGKRGTKYSKTYLDIITAFDIETTALDDIQQSIMYIWQWQFGDYCTVIGRTWDEFISFRDRLKDLMPNDTYLMVFVHNLSYEFQFLTGIYRFIPDEVFAVDSRAVLKCEMSDFLEFRCSYLQTNMSLDSFTKKMGAKHQKLSGAEFDYSKKRYPYTELTDKELQYCINDVKGLVEAMTIQMNNDGDDLYTLPLTSTGYVRRDCKRAIYYLAKSYIRPILPGWELYNMMREAFRGGNTHANRYYVGRIVRKVKSADRSSSYPDVLCNCPYPVKPFRKVENIQFEHIKELIRDKGKAVIMRCELWNVRLKDPTWGAPYLARNKCRFVNDGNFDNGRILEASYLETTITDIDLSIIEAEYDFQITITEAYQSSYGMLPDALIRTIIRYYKDKTELKGVEGQEYYYMKAKNKLNSIYGMMAQDPVKMNIIYKDDEFQLEDGQDPRVVLEEHNAHAWLPYQWGVWTTAWARLRLEEGIRMAGSGFVYADTDSVKYVGDINWDSYNKERMRASRESGAYATDPTGHKHYMGVYEFEGEYEEFTTLGAKKYGYREDGKLHITIAGVNKSKGAAELEASGGLKAFKMGFIFKDAGGVEAVYNDLHEPFIIFIDDYRYEITRNIYLHNSTYTLGITTEYSILLSKLKQNLRKYY